MNELRPILQVHCTVEFPYWQQALQISTASDATPFTCKCRNAAPSQREITFVFSHICGLPRPLPIYQRGEQTADWKGVHLQIEETACNPALDGPGSGKRSLQKERGSFLLTWEEISGLLCFSSKLWLSNPARSHHGSTAFQSGASNSEKLILNRDTLHLPTEHLAGKHYLDSARLPGLLKLGY